MLISGAPLMLNEVVFFHTKSSTLIVADAFYSGHCCTHYGQTNPKPENQSNLEKKSEVMPPNAFTRIWFKMTKDHWCSPQLPSYRTTRVLSNGNPEVLLSCIKSIIKGTYWVNTPFLSFEHLWILIPYRVGTFKNDLCTWR